MKVKMSWGILKEESSHGDVETMLSKAPDAFTSHHEPPNPL